MSMPLMPVRDVFNQPPPPEKHQKPNRSSLFAKPNTVDQRSREQRTNTVASPTIHKEIKREAPPLNKRFSHSEDTRKAEEERAGRRKSLQDQKAESEIFDFEEEERFVEDGIPLEWTSPQSHRWGSTQK